MSLRLMFWNAGVMPTHGKGVRDAEAAARVINAALADGIDLVAVCEVDQGAVRTIASSLTVYGCRNTALVDPIGRSRWDLAVFYRSEILSCRTGKPAVGRVGGKYVRAGHSVLVRHRNERLSFRMYLLHWRSRLHGQRDHREEAAISLRASVRADLRQDRPVIVMGDFNEEPFDPPLTKLSACRDPVHVLRAPGERLYNPCWWLAAPPEADPWSAFGSFAYRAGRTSGRYLFDQALTSAHFLDRETGVAPRARLFPLTSLGLPDPATIDHLPLELSLP